MRKKSRRKNCTRTSFSLQLFGWRFVLQRLAKRNAPRRVPLAQGELIAADGG